MRIIYTLSVFIILITFSCQNTNSQNSKDKSEQDSIPATAEKKEIIVGAARLDNYLTDLFGKKVALVANQSALVGEKHLVDVLLEKQVELVKVFAPEHGFRGNADRGKQISDEVDRKTGLPIISMFGKNKKPSAEALADVDVVIFDIQDAGARFFTYISSMHYVMEACAENNKKLIILDRPNPLGDYVDGPIRENGFESFVGVHPIPIVHGLTVGELAQMINGEKWLKNEVQCKLKIVKVENYNHSMKYELPVKPSPNLPNYLSLRLYPSLCFFEATEISIGRGTKFPFQVIGYPNKSFGNFTFTPQDMEGMQINPVQEGKTCYGIDLRNQKPENIKFTLKYVIDFYRKADFKETFFKRENWFNLLAGNDKLIKQIKQGLNEKEIKETWQADLEAYKKMREKYLLYE